MDRFRIGSEVEGAFSRARFVDYYTVPRMMKEAGFATTIENHRYETHWDVHQESLSTPEGTFALEVASRVMPVSEYFKEIRRFFDFLGEDFYTNSSCGFHHGVSYIDDSLNQLLKQRALLAFYLWVEKHERFELHRWGRDGNRYVRRLESFKYILREYDGVSQVVSLPVSLGKLVSANFGNLKRDKPYVEIRVPGNTNYQNRLDDVAATLNNVMQMFDNVTNPTGSIVDDFTVYLKVHVKSHLVPEVLKAMAL